MPEFTLQMSYSPFIFKPWASSIHNARLQINFQVANVNSKFSSSIISDGTLGRKNFKKQKKKQYTVLDFVGILNFNCT